MVLKLWRGDWHRARDHLLGLMALRLVGLMALG
jgi:hypothetical protein